MPSNLLNIIRQVFLWNHKNQSEFLVCMFGFEPNEFFEALFVQSFGKVPEIEFFQAVSGGSINNAAKLATSEGVFFLKWNENTPDDMFEKEIQGLQLLEQKGMKTPRIIATGKQQGKNYLLLEYLEGWAKSTFWTQLGENLATLHQHSASRFGLDYNNYLGLLPQNNTFYENGIDFFIQERLKVQAGLAFYNHLVNQEFLDTLEIFYEKLPDLIPQEKPALLHGDLWSGNVIADNQGNAVVIDPAVYYGLREAEIAFTRLFGGFEEEFYQSYQSNFPLSSGFEERTKIYNLYPLLVHLNLFGVSYLPSIRRTIQYYVGV